MKNTIIVISIILIAGLTTLAYFTYENNKRLEADLTHLNNTIDTKVRIEVNKVRMKVTDSLLAIQDSLPPIKEVETKVQYKYDTITNYIHTRSINDQYRWSARELQRLYKDNGFGVHFKSGTFD